MNKSLNRYPLRSHFGNNRPECVTDSWLARRLIRAPTEARVDTEVNLNITLCTTHLTGGKRGEFKDEGSSSKSDRNR